MGVGISILVLAAGAIMTWALDVRSGWFDLDVVGVILMVVGAIGLVWSLVIAGTGWRGGDRVIEEHGHRH